MILIELLLVSVYECVYTLNMCSRLRCQKSAQYNIGQDKNADLDGVVFSISLVILTIGKITPPNLVNANSYFR